MRLMRRCLALVMGLLLACLAGARAGEADDQYIEIYKVIRQADGLNEGGQFSQAMAKYSEARGALQAFHKAYPDWNVIAVNYRLDYVASKITEVSGKLPAPGTSAASQTNASRASSGAASQPGAEQVPAEGTNQFNALQEQVRQLQAEKGQLQMDRDQLLADKGLLEAKLKEALTVQPAASDPRELAKAEQRIKALQKENELLSVSLEQARAGKPGVPPPSPAPARAASADAERLKQAEWQRDELAKKLEAANKALAARKSSSRAETQNEINNLRAKLETLEAQKAPYTAEELALFKPSEATLAPTNIVRKPVREIPAGMAALVAQARSYFFTKQYDKAEALYLQVLREDERNVGALADLAFIQVMLNRLDAAEKHLKQALEIAPDDAYALLILGRLRMLQKNYDDALQALSRAAQGDPQNVQVQSEIQNDLGVVLVQKGQRGPAEAAFRKAILLHPTNGDAHKHLALFYLSQEPPLVELGRWHYQKALAAGMPHDAELEKLLESKKAAPH